MVCICLYMDKETLQKRKEYYIEYRKTDTYKKNYKEKYSKTNYKTRQKTLFKRKLMLDQFKMERGCEICGWNGHPFALEFDHVNGKKINNVSQLVSCSLKRLTEEIQKCRIICANCHRLKSLYNTIKNTSTEGFYENNSDLYNLQHLEEVYA